MEPIIAIHQNRLVTAANSCLTCRRAHYYAVNDTPKSNHQEPTHRVTSSAHVRARQALQDVVIAELDERGWQTLTDPLEETEQPYRFQLTPRLLLTNIQPQLTRHPQHTNDHWVPLDIRSRGNRAYTRWQHRGVLLSHPDTAASIAIAHALLAQQDRIHPKAPAVMGVLNTDNFEVDIATLPAQQIQQVLESVAEHLAPLAELLLDEPDGEPPSPDHEPNSRQCQRCPWLTTCGNSADTDDAAERDDTDADTPSEDQAQQALNAWVAADREIKTVSLAQKTKKQARDTLVAWLNSQSLDTASVADQDGVLRKINLSSYPRNSPNIKTIQRMLTAEQYDQAVPYVTQQRLTVK